MSTMLSTAQRITPEISPDKRTMSQYSKPQRVLACVLCQQRKVKCDRKYPCANCVKSRAQCVPATQVKRQRRRRFPERELLERLRKYEGLLRHNNIKFEPLHKEPAVSENEYPSVEGGYDSDKEEPKSTGANSPSQSTTVNSEREYEAKNIWHAMIQGLRDPDCSSDYSDDNESEIRAKNVWHQLFGNDLLLFGSHKTAVDLSTLHPEPVQIFRLWQLYLDNVNPLLKVTHTQSLQGRIIDAAGDVSNIEPTLEALMFSIYCMSVTSLATDECQAMFGSSKADLLTKYQFGCQQALLNSRFLRCGSLDCLTALYLYLVSVRPNTLPQSLSSMLGVAVRIAQRMGCHSEAILAKCTALEAEMRRRLWWSLILFDARIGELADFKTTILTPTWDCRIPLNVSDSDFRPEMKEPPQAQRQSTEALFAVVRGELGDFVRHSAVHLEFNSPALVALARDVHSEGSELVNLETMIEDKYLKFCDLENPLYFMTMWTARGFLARYRLVEHYSKYCSQSLQNEEAQRDTALSYALTMLECDTKIMASPLTKGFVWLVQCYFPFPAYIQIVNNLKWRPFSERAEYTWEVMNENFEARFGLQRDDTVLFKMFTKLILQAWKAREATYKQSEESLVVPKIVLAIRKKIALIASDAPLPVTEQLNNTTIGSIDFPMSMPMGFDTDSMLYGMGEENYVPGMFPSIPGVTMPNVNMNQLDFSAMDWDLVDTSTASSGSTRPWWW